MAMNKVQFQPGMSLTQLLAAYGTEEQCELAVENVRWPDGFRCPQCDCERYSCYQRKGRIKVFQCCDCRTQTTLTQDTVFHATKLPLTVWFQAIYFLTQSKNNVSALELKRLLGVCYRTAWRVKHKLMQVQYEEERHTRLTGRIEIDDAYLGGENSGVKAGRGSENKTPFIAAVQTNKKGHPIAAIFSPVKSFSKAEVIAFARKSFTPGSTVVSDGLWCFTAVQQAGCIHQREVVGKNRKSTDMNSFNWVNTVLGNLKTSISGTYHSIESKKYCHRYLRECQYRFNRRFDLFEMFKRLFTGAAVTGKRTEMWLRLAEE